MLPNYYIQIDRPDRAHRISQSSHHIRYNPPQGAHGARLPVLGVLRVMRLPISAPRADPHDPEDAYNQYHHPRHHNHGDLRNRDPPGPPISLPAHSS